MAAPAHDGGGKIQFDRLDLAILSTLASAAPVVHDRLGMVLVAAAGILVAAAQMAGGEEAYRVDGEAARIVCEYIDKRSDKKPLHSPADARLCHLRATLTMAVSQDRATTAVRRNFQKQADDAYAGPEGDEVSEGAQME